MNTDGEVEPCHPLYPRMRMTLQRAPIPTQTSQIISAIMITNRRPKKRLSISIQQALAERPVLSASSTLNKATICACCRARANTASTSIVLTLGFCSYLPHARSVEQISMRWRLWRKEIRQAIPLLNHHPVILPRGRVSDDLPLDFPSICDSWNAEDAETRLHPRRQGAASILLKTFPLIQISRRSTPVSSRVSAQSLDLLSLLQPDHPLGLLYLFVQGVLFVLYLGPNDGLVYNYNLNLFRIVDLTCS